MKQSPMTYHILIEGAFSSGKSQFIQTISEIEPFSTERVSELELFSISEIEPFSTERVSELELFSITYDVGRLTITDDLIVFFFGTPGTRRFAPDDIFVSHRCIGTILMVDSSRAETFRAAQSNMRYIRNITHFPIIIAANKQDKHDAWSADDIRIALRIPKEIPVIPCSARDKKSVANVLIALCQEILKRMEADEAGT